MPKHKLQRPLPRSSKVEQGLEELKKAQLQLQLQLQLQQEKEAMRQKALLCSTQALEEETRARNQLYTLFKLEKAAIPDKEFVIVPEEKDSDTAQNQSARGFVIVPEEKDSGTAQNQSASGFVIVPEVKDPGTAQNQSTNPNGFFASIKSSFAASLGWICGSNKI